MVNNNLDSSWTGARALWLLLFLGGTKGRYLRTAGTRDGISRWGRERGRTRSEPRNYDPPLHPDTRLNASQDGF